MYKSFETFEADFKQALKIERERHASVGQKPYFDKNVDISKAWKLYQNAQIPSLNIHLFGRFAENGIDLKSKMVPVKRTIMQRLLRKQTYKQTPSDMHTNFGSVNEVEKKHQGSIQQMESSDWDLHVNDAWLLGGIHKYLPFYAASELKAINMFVISSGSPRKNTILNITGRELLGLLLAGYRPESKHPTLGTVMVCRDKHLAKSLTLKKLETSVDFIDRSIGIDGRVTYKNIAARAGIIL